MISIKEAHKIIEERVSLNQQTGRVNLADALDRVLAEHVFSDIDFPSFDKSAMDGYAIRSEDIRKTLKVIEFIPAGKKPAAMIKPGQCSRIMTGAMLPGGADIVVMQEDVKEVGFKSVMVTNPDTKRNILYKGEDLSKGAMLLPKGTRLNPPHLGLLASAGMTKPLVFFKPTVSILSTGDELVAPDQKPEAPHIRNSNGIQLLALTREAGARVVAVRQSGDDSRKIFNEVRDCLSISEMVIVTGGASVGERDYSARVFEKLRADLHFNKLAIQPGKPLIFATVENKILFGLSGNPVSSFVQFELFVKPTIEKLTGASGKEKIFKLPISKDKTRKKAERMLFFPVAINEDMEAEPIEYHGSAHLHAYHKADGIAAFPVGLKELKKGTLVDVRPF